MYTRMMAAAVLVACSAPRSAPAPVAAPRTARAAAAGPSTLPQHMLAHFAVVSRVQDAVVHGRLGMAQWHARWLLDHDEPLTGPVREGAEPFVDEMRTAARALSHAADLQTAGQIAAQLGRTCSHCHEARRAMVTFAWEPMPSDAPAVDAQLARHTWAAARMWEGLIAPSDEMWSEGADVLATVKLDALQDSGPSRADVSSLAAALHDTAGRARQTSDHDQRGAVYGELLSICGRCHGVIRRP